MFYSEQYSLGTGPSTSNAFHSPLSSTKVMLKQDPSYCPELAMNVNAIPLVYISGSNPDILFPSELKSCMPLFFINFELSAWVVSDPDSPLLNLSQ